MCIRDRLIGLSANVEIILSQVTDVYAVPYDAVGTDENGGSVVYARSGGETEFTACLLYTSFFPAPRGITIPNGTNGRCTCSAKSRWT